MIRLVCVCIGKCQFISLKFRTGLQLWRTYVIVGTKMGLGKNIRKHIRVSDKESLGQCKWKLHDKPGCTETEWKR